VVVVSSGPMVFIGSGSEWFWSMAQFVVVAVTLLGIYYQLRLQRAANAFDQLNRIGEQWEAEQMLRARLVVARAVTTDNDVPHGAFNLVGNYWENVASLVRQGHVNERVVAETYGATGAIWWTALEVSTLKFREARLDPTILENFEWLAGRFSADGAKAGAPLQYDRPTLARIFAAAIPGVVDRIRMAEESRMPPERPTPRPRRSRNPE
jgi:hypothetical protein